MLPQVRAVLTLSALRTVASWQSVKDLYQARGVNFVDDAECLQQVRSDWKVIKDALWTEASRMPLPTDFPVTSVLVDGKQVAILGICHHIGVFAEVQALLLKRTSHVSCLITEQNLGIMNLGMHSRGLDIPDHLARGTLNTFISMEMQDWISLGRLVRGGVASLAELFNPRKVLDDPLLKATSEVGKKIESAQAQYGFGNRKVAEFSRLGLFLPGDFWSELPANVELAYKHEKAIPYSMAQARSAYMAEFIRHWDIEATIRKDLPEIPSTQMAQAAASKTFLCGQQHEPEVAYFLAHGSREEAVAVRAQHDASVLSTRGGRGYVEWYQRKMALLHGSRLVWSMVRGGLIGWGAVSSLS